MNNDEQNDNDARDLPFPNGFHIGTALQNVLRNINHAFATNHDSRGGQHRDDNSRNDADDLPPLEPLSSAAGAHDARPTHISHPVPDSSTSASSASPPEDVDMPSGSQPDPPQDDDEDSMPDLRSVSDESDESDAGSAPANPGPPHQHVQAVDQDRNDDRIDGEDAPPPLEPITGTRRTRVDDDVDDARDRRHPSERVGAPSPSGEAAPQGANPQQPLRPPTGLFGALFGLGPPGANIPGGEAPSEQAQTGEDATDPSPTGNNATPGRAPRGAPVLTAGFTFTIPLFGPGPGNRPGPTAGGLPGQGQGVPPNMFGMDAASREELFAAFATFFQQFQAMEEGREDPERAKKLVAGLDVVPLGLVKRLERVGGAPGGHVGDGSTEGASTGCAICWDTLLDGESDNFISQQPSGGEPAQPPSVGTDTDATHTSSSAMDVDATSEGTSATTPSSTEPPKIISLPCAHVFHATCLLPWFTRAKQATCPTCRFNIDPENLTYTPPPRRAFNRPPPVQPENAPQNAAPAGPQAVPEAPTGARVPGAAEPPEGAAPAAAAGPAPIPPIGQDGGMPAGPGPHPFVNIPGIPFLSLPAIQIPLRPAGDQAPGGGNQGIDVLTIGLDMFVGGMPPEEQDANPRDNTASADGADNNGAAGTGAAGGNGVPNPNGLAQDLQSLIEGLLRTTRNIIPQVINAQGGAPGAGPAPAAPADGAQPHPQPHALEVPPPPADDAQPQPQAGPQPIPLGAGPRGMPIFPFPPMMFRPTRPMPPRRERKTWTLPPAPGPSLRQRVEQREREQGLRCSDTSCDVGPSDDDPYPEPSASSTKQISIHPLPPAGEHESDVHASVCTHAFHPACLVSAERVAGWGGDEDEATPLVEVSCPVCRAVGCVTRGEWESGVSAL